MRTTSEPTMLFPNPLSLFASMSRCRCPAAFIFGICSPPILRVYMAASSLANQAYSACLWIAASTVRPLLEARLGLTIDVYLDPVFGYVGYFVIGATLSHAVPSRMPTRWLCG